MAHISQLSSSRNCLDTGSRFVTFLKGKLQATVACWFDYVSKPREFPPKSLCSIELISPQQPCMKLTVNLSTQRLSWSSANFSSASLGIDFAAHTRSLPPRLDAITLTRAHAYVIFLSNCYDRCSLLLQNDEGSAPPLSKNNKK